MRTVLLALALSVLARGDFAHAQQDQQKVDKQAGTEKRSAPARPSVDKQMPQPPREKASGAEVTNDRSDAWTRSEVMDAITAGATAIGLCVAIAVLIVTGGFNRKALAQTREALDETRKSNKLMEREMRLAHRPSIHMEGVQTTAGEGSNQRLTICINWRNAGTDTAHDIRFRGEFRAGVVSDEWLGALEPNAHAGDLGAGLKFQTTVDANDLTAAAPGVRDLLADESKTARFAGVLAYRDEFGVQYRYEFVRKRQGVTWIREVERHLHRDPPDTAPP